MLHFFLSLLLNVLDVSYGNQNYNFHYSLKFLVYRHPRIKDVKKNLLKQKLKVHFTGPTALNSFHRKAHTAIPPVLESPLPLFGHGHAHP